jgi:hypothetical protein
MRAPKWLLPLLFMLIAPIGARAQTIGTWTNASSVSYTYFLFVPPNPRPGNPWVLVGPATSALGGDWNTQVVADFVARGIYVASIWLPGLNGSNEGYGLQYAQVDPWVTYMISTYSLAAKPSVWLQSRAALDIGTWASINPTKIVALAGEYPIVGGPLEYPGDNSTLWNAWNMTQSAAEAFAPTVTPNNYVANLLAAGTRVRLWQGLADTTAQPPLTSVYLAGIGPTASEVLVENMGHVTYYNKDMVDFLDPYIPIKPIASIACPSHHVISANGTDGPYIAGRQLATNANGTGTVYNPQSFNQTRNRYLWCQRTNSP